MKHRIRCCWLICAITSVLACAGSQQGRSRSPVMVPVSPSADREDFALTQNTPAESTMTVVQLQHALEQAQYKYEIARDAAERKDTAVAKAAIDDALVLMVITSEVEDSTLTTARESLLKKLSRLIVAIHEGRIGGGPRGKIPLVVNARVEREIQGFLGRDRNALLSSYVRSGLYSETIKRELSARGLPPELLWLPVVESGFTPRAQSSAQAVGLWQFIMATGQRYSLKRDAWTDDRMDPYKATTAAVAHLSDLYDVLGDWLLAVAAYNCGEERVLWAMNRQGAYDFWQLSLPKETQRYVPRFLAVVSIFSNPEQYHVTLPTPQSPYAFDECSVDKSIALADAARVIGVSHEQLKVLNPALRNGITPPTGYRLRIPAGLGPLLLASLDTLPLARLAPQTNSRGYIVRRGETLSGIAKKFGTTTATLKKTNHLKGNKLRAGQSLQIPGLVEEVMAPTVAQTSAPAKSAAVAEQAASPAKSPNSVAPQSYKVRRGETLSGIAKKFGTTVTALRQANHLTRTNLVKAGQVLTLPDAGAGEQMASIHPSFERPVSTSIPSNSMENEVFPTTHIVKAGDTIWSIARQYGLSVPELMELNGLKRGEMIQRGQSLIIVPPGSRTVYHTVGQGDTLYSISKTHDVPIRSLMEWNHLNSFEVKTGQRLKIVLSQ